MQTHEIPTDLACELCQTRTATHLVSTSEGVQLCDSETYKRLGTRLVVCDSCVPHVTEYDCNARKVSE